MDQRSTILMPHIAAIAVAIASTALVMGIFVGVCMWLDRPVALAELGLCLFLFVLSLLNLLRLHNVTEQKMEAWFVSWEEMAARVDPWEQQRMLMAASGQRMATRYPRMHNGVLLYAALLMEELGETLEAVGDACAHAPSFPVGLPAVAVEYYKVGKALQERALIVRNTLAVMEPVDFLLPDADALAMFDGTTDIAVVNCGFALSAGLPGAEGYAEVANSNLSKINPDSGKIDKTPDGKWIKGTNFFKPDLTRVIATGHAARNGR